MVVCRCDTLISNIFKLSVMVIILWWQTCLVPVVVSRQDCLLLSEWCDSAHSLALAVGCQHGLTSMIYLDCPNRTSHVQSLVHHCITSDTIPFDILQIPIVCIPQLTLNYLQLWKKDSSVNLKIVLFKIKILRRIFISINTIYFIIALILHLNWNFNVLIFLIKKT